jgi:hypothetical protein
MESGAYRHDSITVASTGEAWKVDAARGISPGEKNDKGAKTKIIARIKAVGEFEKRAVITGEKISGKLQQPGPLLNSGASRLQPASMRTSKNL